MHISPIAAFLGLMLLASALPIPLAYASSTLTAASLLTIAPETASCTGADFPDECADATTAAPNIAMSFTNFNIASFGAQAALVAIQLFESGNFKYNKNHYPAPGTPGQGTRNMQSPAYNEEYAMWFAEDCVNCGISVEDVNDAKAQGPSAVLALVNTDEWSFGSAAWFLKAQCDVSIEEGLASQSQAGWQAYIEQCVGTTLTEERTAGWEKVIALQHW